MAEDAAATVTLDPLDRVDLSEPFRSGYNMVPTSRGPNVVVEFDEEVINVWGLVVHYHPEIIATLAGLLIVATLLLHWRARRRRPQAQPGEPYCRRCGYGLTGVTSDHCPECGVTLNERSVRTARQRRRLWPILESVFIMLVLAGAAAWLIWGPSRDHPIRNDYQWPSAWAHRVTAGKLGGWSDPLRRDQCVLQVIHTPDGRRRTLARGDEIEQISWPDPMPHRFDIVVGGPDAFTVIDMATGRTRGQVQPQPVGEVRGSPYVSRYGRTIHATTADHFVRWDADTLAPLPPILKPNELDGMSWWYFACPIDEGVMVMLDMERLIRVDPNGRVLYTIDAPDGGFSNQWPTTPDGRAFLRNASGDQRVVYEYDLADGSLRRTWRFADDVDRCALSFDGQRLMVVCDTRLGDTLTVWSVADQRALAELRLPGSWEIENADFSSDDRRVVVLAHAAAGASSAVFSFDATGIPSP